MKELVGILDCKVGALPTTYLGLSLGTPYKSYKVCKGMEKCFQKRIAWWKGQSLLGESGRQILITSTFSSLLIYFMPLFAILKRVALGLEKIHRDFL